MTRSKALSLIAFLAFLFFTIPGCGVIFGGTSETISIASSPDGADVEVAQSGGESGFQRTTPTEIDLKRKHDYVVTFQKEGYETRTAEIKHSLRAGVLIGDILLGVVPIIVDAATGAWHGLSPDRIDVTLQQSEAAMVDSGPDEIHVQMSKNGNGSSYEVEADEPVHVNIQKKEE